MPTEISSSGQTNPERPQPTTTHDLINKVLHLIEHLQAKQLLEPTGENLIKLMQLLKRKCKHKEYYSHHQDIVEITPWTITHTYSNSNSAVDSRGVRVTVRQLLPSATVGERKYLSATFSFDERSPQLTIHTGMEERVDPQTFHRIGDLRMDAIDTTTGQFTIDTTLSQGGRLGAPTGEWSMDLNQLDGALRRAYALVLSSVYGLGEVPALGKNPPRSQRLFT